MDKLEDFKMAVAYLDFMERGFLYDGWDFARLQREVIYLHDTLEKRLKATER